MLVLHPIKIYPDSIVHTISESSRIQKKSTLKCGFKKLRIRMPNSHEFMGYVWTEGESEKKKLWIQQVSGYAWTGPKLQ